MGKLPEGVVHSEMPPGELMERWVAMRDKRLELLGDRVQGDNIGAFSTVEDYIDSVKTEWAAWEVVIDDDNFQEQFDTLRTDLATSFSIGMIETEGNIAAVVTGLWLDGISLGMALARK